MAQLVRKKIYNTERRMKVGDSWGEGVLGGWK